MRRALWSEALDKAHMPLAANDGSRRGRLADDMSCGNVDTVEVVINAEIEAQRRSFVGGLGYGESFEAGDGDFRSVDGEVHGGDGREHGQPCTSRMSTNWNARNIYIRRIRLDYIRCIFVGLYPAYFLLDYIRRIFAERLLISVLNGEINLDGFLQHL